MYFSPEYIEELNSKVDILSLVSAYTSVKRSGSNFLALCPFHREKTPSMCVYVKTNSFYCFGCSVGGDAISFLMQIDGLSYQDAVISLAERVGMPVETVENHDDFAKKKVVYAINREAARIYFENLFSKSGKVALDYLLKRGLSINTIKKFGIGFSFFDKNFLFEKLKNKFESSDLMSSGLFFQSKGEISDRFVGRIMFPLIDLKGNVIAFGARAIGNRVPKYLNTSDTVVFKKSKNLFALNFVKGKKFLILTEGYMDTVSLHQAGVDCAVASLGTALNKCQAKLISKYFNDVYICYDSDDAGQIATDRAIEVLHAENLNVKVILLPKGKDPDEFVKIFGDSAKSKFEKLIESSLRYVDYKLHRIKLGLDLNNPDDRIKFLKKSSQIISEIDDPIERDIYSSQMSLKYKVSKNAFDLQINKCINNRSDFKRTQKDKFRYDLNGSGSSGAEEFLLSSIMGYGNFPKYLFELSRKNFHNDMCFSIFQTLKKLSYEKKHLDFATVSGYIDKKKFSDFVRVSNMRGSEVVSEDDIRKAFEILMEDGNFREFSSINETNDNDVLEFLKKLKENKK